MHAIDGGKKSPDNGRKEAIHVTVANVLLRGCRASGEPLMTLIEPGGGTRIFQCRDGIWIERTSLDLLINECAIGMGLETTAKLRTEVSKWIAALPDIANDDIDFDAHGMIPCANGLLDPETMTLRPYTPADLATRRGALEFVEGAQSPLFDMLLASFFADRNPDEAKALVDLIQEFFGASLALHMLPREARKALLVVGPTRSGKTVLADIFKLFIGGVSAGPSVAELSGRFGLESLYGASSWVRDDAINEGDALDPQRFKVVVTGEQVDVARKNKGSVQHRFTIPVLLTTNALPDAKDASDAIYNRSLIVKFTSQRGEGEAMMLRRKYGVPKTSNLAKHIVDSEGPGILNWALEGFLRVYERGYYVIPETVQAAIQDFKDKNNPIGEWARSAIEYDEGYKVNRADLLCCFHGWQKEMQGDAARALGGHKFTPQFRDVFPRAGETRSGSDGRYFTHIRLTPEGQEWWRQHNLEPLKGGSKGKSLSPDSVSKPMSRW
jgi:P4 family phage/plasmid primase-like protien